MKPNRERIADLWCRFMHTEPMWPSHGWYECRKCGRRHRVCWEESSLPSRMSLWHRPTVLRQHINLAFKTSTGVLGASLQTCEESPRQVVPDSEPLPVYSISQRIAQLRITKGTVCPSSRCRTAQSGRHLAAATGIRPGEFSP